jgi:hypothetical protein
MLPRGSRLLFATAAGLLVVHASILLGGPLREAAVAFCALALLVGAPIAVLVWFGSLSELEAKRSERRRQVKLQRSEALLWQRTLEELRLSAGAPPRGPAPSMSEASHSVEPALARVGAALARSVDEGKRATRPILALFLAVASSIGFAGCGVPAEAWAFVRPGMGTAELVSVVGGPDYVRSNGPVEVWQYCRDFPGRDEGRYARYYTAVLVENEQVKDVRPYPVLSNAGCKDFYRAEF